MYNIYASKITYKYACKHTKRENWIEYNIFKNNFRLCYLQKGYLGLPVKIYYSTATYFDIVNTVN